MIECNKNVQIERESKCIKPLDSNQMCLKVIQLSILSLNDCKCVQKLLKFKQRCCHPKAEVNQKCNPNKNIWIWIIKNYTLIDGSVS